MLHASLCVSVFWRLTEYIYEYIYIYIYIYIILIGSGCRGLYIILGVPCGGVTEQQSIASIVSRPIIINYNSAEKPVVDAHK